MEFALLIKIFTNLASFLFFNAVYIINLLVYLFNHKTLFILINLITIYHLLFLILSFSFLSIFLEFKYQKLEFFRHFLFKLKVDFQFLII